MFSYKLDLNCWANMDDFCKSSYIYHSTLLLMLYVHTLGSALSNIKVDKGALCYVVDLMLKI